MNANQLISNNKHGKLICCPPIITRMGFVNLFNPQKHSLALPALTVYVKINIIFRGLHVRRKGLMNINEDETITTLSTTYT